MTSTHPPVHAHAGVRHHREWLWMGLAVVLIALIAGGVTWLVMQPDEIVAAAPESVAGFEVENEATPMHVASPGVTTQYFGHSGELYPAIQVLPAARGFATDHEATSYHLAQPGVTTDYFGFSGELYPAIQVLPAARGFAMDHEVTPIQIAKPGVTTNYFGNSGELFADD